MLVKKITAGLFVCVFVCIAFILSCDVGLGEAVDTYPPKLSLEYPAGDSLVIRDTFVMKGEADDETKITSVKISFSPTEGSSAPAGFKKSYNAELNPENKRWSCRVNNILAGDDKKSGYEIPDGEYQVSVVATDSAKRTT